jgi:hypothetical protein
MCRWDLSCFLLPICFTMGCVCSAFITSTLHLPSRRPTAMCALQSYFLTVLQFLDAVVSTAEELFFLEALASATSLVALFFFEPLASATSLVAVLVEVLSSCSLFGLPAWLHSNSYLISSPVTVDFLDDVARILNPILKA